MKVQASEKKLAEIETRWQKLLDDMRAEGAESRSLTAKEAVQEYLENIEGDPETILTVEEYENILFN